MIGRATVRAELDQQMPSIDVHFRQKHGEHQRDIKDRYPQRHHQESHGKPTSPVHWSSVWGRASAPAAMAKRTRPILRGSSMPMSLDTTTAIKGTRR